MVAGILYQYLFILKIPRPAVFYRFFGKVAWLVLPDLPDTDLFCLLLNNLINSKFLQKRAVHITVELGHRVFLYLIAFCCQKVNNSTRTDVQLFCCRK